MLRFRHNRLRLPDDDHAGDGGRADRNCLKTIEAALIGAGFSLKDAVRNHYYVTDAAFADLVFPILGEAFGDIRPAATMVVCDLIRPEMLVEIEVTAFKG